MLKVNQTVLLAMIHSIKVWYNVKELIGRFFLIPGARGSASSLRFFFSNHYVKTKQKQTNSQKLKKQWSAKIVKPLGQIWSLLWNHTEGAFIFLQTLIISHIPFHCILCICSYSSSTEPQISILCHNCPKIHFSHMENRDGSHRNERAFLLGFDQCVLFLTPLDPQQGYLCWPIVFFMSLPCSIKSVGGELKLPGAAVTSVAICHLV